MIRRQLGALLDRILSHWDGEVPEEFIRKWLIAQLDIFVADDNSLRDHGLSREALDDVREAIAACIALGMIEHVPIPSDLSESRSREEFVLPLKLLERGSLLRDADVKFEQCTRLANTGDIHGLRVQTENLLRHIEVKRKSALIVPVVQDHAGQQLARVRTAIGFLNLYRITGDFRYLNVSLKLNDWVLAYIGKQSTPSALSAKLFCSVSRQELSLFELESCES